MTNGDSYQSYAHLPEDLIKKILEAVPDSVSKMNDILAINEQPIDDGMKSLRDNGLIQKLDDFEFTNSVIAVDGGSVMKKLSGADLLLVAAVGVEGLQGKDNGGGWPSGGNQYHHWQTAMVHDEATMRLMQGAMFLMEISVLTGAKYDMKIMDGTHFTPILKINSMLSAREEHAGAEYVQALRNFLSETYQKIIPDIPDIISGLINDDTIIASVKYSSSRDILDSHLPDSGITFDDKTFFALGLEENEYTKPLSVGQSQQEQRKIWDDLHIKCNLDIDEQCQLNKMLEEAIAPIRTKCDDQPQESELYFTYFKPHRNGLAYRIEIKNSLAHDVNRLKKMLATIKQQIVFPDILEPFPQYLADLMAKSVSGGLYAMQDAVRLSPELSLDDGRLALLFPYRSN